MNADLHEAERLLARGMHLVALEPYTKRPKGLNWNASGNRVRAIRREATGYGVLLASNRLVSLDPDDLPKALKGMAALGFDLEKLMDSGVRSISTRPGSGGRSTFQEPEDLGLEWVSFRAKGQSGPFLELRARSPNLQDVIPGSVARDKAGALRSFSYVNARRLDAPPPLPDELLEWWRRLSSDLDFRRDQEERFAAANGLDARRSVSVGGTDNRVVLAFSSRCRGAFNADTEVEELLARHGYADNGERWSAPGASGAPGIRPIPGKEGLWQSDHASDPLMGTFDAWSAFVALDHNGDVQAAEAAFKAGGVRADFAATATESLPPQSLVPTARPADRAKTPSPYPGPMAEIAGEILKTAHVQQEAFATLAAVAAMAAAITPTYALQDGGRLNLYCLGLGTSGSGKDLPRRAAVEVAEECGAAILARPGSGQGLEDALVAGRGMLVEIDEVGHVLAAASGSRAPAHQVALNENLLRLYSAGSTNWRPRILASPRGRPSAASRPIANPCLSIIAFTTPAALGRAIGIGQIEDGLLGRFLFAAADPTALPRRTTVSFEVPVSVKKFWGPQVMDDFLLNVPITVVADPGAQGELEATLLALHQQSQHAATSFAQTLLVRSFEKVARLAGVLAVWTDPRKPIIAADHVVWAKQFVAASNAVMLDFVEHHMHEGQVLAHAARVEQLLDRMLTDKPAGELRPADIDALRQGWVPHSLLLRRSKLPQEDLRRAIEHLHEAELIEIAAVDRPAASGGTRGVRHYRRRAEPAR
jgi:hypothetical protein